MSLNFHLLPPGNLKRNLLSGDEEFLAQHTIFPKS